MRNLRISKLTPFIGSKNYEESKEFYQAIGFKKNFDLPDITEMQLGNYCFYLQRYYQRKWCENSMLHFTVEDAHAWYEQVKSVLDEKKFGAARVDPPKEQSYGSLVTFVWDPVGILLHFAQPLEK